MDSDSWIVENLENALGTWNEKMAEIWQLITQSPEEFKGGVIWDVMVDIHDAIMAIGLGLLVLFFLVGLVKTCGSFSELKKPEIVVKTFVRFVIAKTVVTRGGGVNAFIVQHCVGGYPKNHEYGRDNLSAESVLSDRIKEIIDKIRQCDKLMS